MKRSQKIHNKVNILLILIGAFTCGGYTLITAIVPNCSSSPKTHVKAQVNGIAMVIKQFKGDYGHLPQNWESLEGKNWRGKIYYSGDKTNLEGNEIHIIYDTDGDNIIEFKNQKIQDSVAVWTMYKEEMITSWEK